MGYGKLPVCIAKTQYSFSTNADSKGAPVDHTITGARGAALRRGRVRGGDLRRDHDHARGLPRVPVADFIDVGDDGKIVGLF